MTNRKHLSPAMQAAIDIVDLLKPEQPVHPPESDPRLTNLKTFLRMAQDNTSMARDSLAISESNLRAAKALEAEILCRIEVLEQELGIRAYDCPCGNKTSNPHGCHVCLKASAS